MRGLLRIGAAVLGLGLMAGCTSSTAESRSGDAPTAEPAADSPPAITLYNGRSEELVSPILAEFTEDTGIVVEVRSAGSGELGAQLLTEGQATPADVFLSQDAGALGAVAKAGLFAALPEAILDRVPRPYQAPDGTWVGTSGRARVVIYNPDVVTKAPTTIDEVVAGAYQGQIGYAPTNASWQSFVTGLRMLRGEDGARDWLKRFAASQPRAYEGNSQVRDAVEAGEVGVGLINHYYLYELTSQRADGSVRARNQFMSAGDPGGLVNVAGIGVLAASDSPEQARELVDFLTSRKAQKYFAEKTFEYPLIAGVAPAAGLPTLAELDPPQLDLSDLDSIAATQALLAEVGLLTQ